MKYFSGAVKARALITPKLSGFSKMMLAQPKGNAVRKIKQVGKRNCCPCSKFLFPMNFSPFYWVGFVAQRERAQQDFKVPYKMPHLTHPPFTYERQPMHRDHPTLIRIVRGFFTVSQNYQHSRNCETGPPVYRPYLRRPESLTICR